MSQGSASTATKLLQLNDHNFDLVIFSPQFAQTSGWWDKIKDSVSSAYDSAKKSVSGAYEAAHKALSGSTD